MCVESAFLLNTNQNVPKTGKKFKHPRVVKMEIVANNPTLKRRTQNNPKKRRNKTTNKQQIMQKTKTHPITNNQKNQSQPTSSPGAKKAVNHHKIRVTAIMELGRSAQSTTIHRHQNT